MKLVIQIPCYNEEKNIADTLKSIPAQIDGVDEIVKLVIDDGSFDRTSDLAKENGASFVVKLRRNMGLAKAFQAGLTESLNLGADIVVNTDGDTVPMIGFPYFLLCYHGVADMSNANSGGGQNCGQASEDLDGF